MEHPALSVSHLSFSYDSRTVLEDVSFTVRRGEYVGIIGPNGGGKTTLLKLLLGLLPLQEGEVKLLGTSLGRFSQWERIGYVPQVVLQEAGLFFPATSFEVVLSGLTAKKRRGEHFSREDKERARKLLHQMGLGSVIASRIGSLSGGQRQRVFLARALVSQPEILFLDAASQEQFYALLRNLHEQGMTILFVSHDIDIVSREVETVLCLNRRMVCHATPEEFLRSDALERMYGKGTFKLVHHQEKHHLHHDGTNCSSS